MAVNALAQHTTFYSRLLPSAERIAFDVQQEYVYCLYYSLIYGDEFTSFMN